MARNADRWRMFAVTLPGFGGTAVPDLPVDSDDAVWHDNAVNAVSRLLEERDLRDVVLVGHSFGSVIALQVAAKNPTRVTRLINVDGGIVSSRAWFPDDPAARPAAARALTAANAERYADVEAWRQFNSPSMFDERRRGDYRATFLATPRSVVFQYWRENLIRDLNPLLKTLQQPVLDLKAIPASDPDPAATRSRHLAALREAGAPASLTSVFFENTGHFVQEDRPQLLEDAIVAFLAGRPVADAVYADPRIAVRGRFGEVKHVGSGRTPMILMPCLGCDWRAFDEFMDRNAQAYRMYAVTWPGMGSTSLPRVTGARHTTPLLDNVVEALARLIRTETLDRPVLVAHSAAGPVAVRFASQFPDLVGRVITVDATIQNDTTLGFTPAERLDWAEAEMAQVLRQYDDAEAWLRLNSPAAGSTRNPARLGMYKAMWLTPPRANVFAYWREWLMLDSGSMLRNLTVPTLAMFAIGADVTDPSAMRDRISSQFRRNSAAPVISLEFIERATHSIWESRPNAFDRAVARFITEAGR